MADFNVQFYVYRNQNIRGIILDKIYNYHTVIVEAHNYNYIHWTCNSILLAFQFLNYLNVNMAAYY